MTDDHFDILINLMISDTGVLREAMVKLTASGKGLLCVANSKKEVVGVLSDGDIRNALLKNGNMDECVSQYMTRNFAYASEGATKEQILKLLDNRVKQVPILNSQRHLISMAGAGYLDLSGSVYARGKAPARISFAGGGTDFTNYFLGHGGVSLSATIAKYSHVVMRKRDDSKILISLADQPEPFEANDIGELRYGTPFDLIVAAIRVMKPKFGLELYCSCDYAPGSGLGGSAALLSAVVGCMNEFREEKLDSYAIAEHAFEIERIELGFPGGWQDQYATVFGGINYIEYNQENNSVMPFRLQANIIHELEERLLLCYTGRAHLGRQIQQKNTRREGNDKMIEFGLKAKEIARIMRKDLLRGRLNDFGRLLYESWQLKKTLIEDASSTELDDIYDVAMKSGADGGRLLGTGGGGYFLFCVPPFERHKVWGALEDKGLKVESVVFDSLGMKSWTIRG